MEDLSIGSMLAITRSEALEEIDRAMGLTDEDAELFPAYLKVMDSLGYAMLPKEATEEMKLATRDYDYWPHPHCDGQFAVRDTDSAASEIYSAMAAAFEGE